MQESTPVPPCERLCVVSLSQPSRRDLVYPLWDVPYLRKKKHKERFQSFVCRVPFQMETPGGYHRSHNARAPNYSVTPLVSLCSSCMYVYFCSSRVLVFMSCACDHVANNINKAQKYLKKKKIKGLISNVMKIFKKSLSQNLKKSQQIKKSQKITKICKRKSQKSQNSWKKSQKSQKSQKSLKNHKNLKNL